MDNLPGLDVGALTAHVRRAGLTGATTLEVHLISGGRSNLTFGVTAGDEALGAASPSAG